MTDQATPKPAKKKAVNGRDKGAGFELTMAKTLSTYFTPLEFRRSQSSGAILGGKNQVFLNRFSEAAKTLFIGDIVPTNEADVLRDQKWTFRFTIECKFYKEADSFQALLKNHQMIGWFEQAKHDASKMQGKEPMLIFKFNHTPIFVGIDPMKVTLPSDMPSMRLKYAYNHKYEHIEVVLFDDLIKHLDWWKQHEV